MINTTPHGMQRVKLIVDFDGRWKMEDWKIEVDG